MPFVEIIIATFGSVVFTIHILLLIVWIIVLLKKSIQLRKNVKYSVVPFLNQNGILETLNVKLEYRKCLFLLAIVSFELISSFLSISSCSEIIINGISDLSIYENITILIPFTSYLPNIINNSNVVVDNLSNPLLGYNLFRVVYAFFGLSLILVFSPVYILMSYYAMVIKNSLSFNVSMKSVDLASEQKNLIAFSFALFIMLVIPLVSVKLFILYEFVKIIVSIVQLILTFHYSSKLVCVFKWKILDTKVAFGIDHYLFKYYTKSLGTFKRCVIFYKIVVTSFCLFTIICAIRNLMILNSFELHHIFGIYLKLFQSNVYVNSLIHIDVFLLIIQRICLILYLVSIFILSLSTIPYLLSRMNFRCLSKYFTISYNKDLTESLLYS